MNNQSQKISIVEKVGYSLGDLAANLVFQTLVTFLAYFYTEIYGLDPNDASLVMLIVGLIAAFAFNPVIGALADRTNSRWGKFRPWILYTSIPLGAVALLAFITPDFAYKGKIVYATITYTLLLLLYAGNNLPYSALSGVITGNMKERNSISSIRFFAVLVAQLFVQGFMKPIVEFVGNGNKAAGMEVVMTWLAVIGTVLLIITFITTRERVVPPSEQKTPLKDDLSDLMKNRPWIIMLSVTVLIFITLAVKGGGYVFYFDYFVDPDALAAFIKPVIDGLNAIGWTFFGTDPASAGFGLFNIGGIVSMMIGISFSKKLADKFGKRDIFMSALFVSTLFVLAFAFFKPENVKIMFLSQILHGFFYGITMPILWAMIADVADYSEWKNNRRATAIIFSAMLAGLKAGLSIGGAIVSWVLGLYGFLTKGMVEAGQEIIQPDTVAQGSKMLISVYASIPFFISVALLFFYIINKKMEDKLEKDLLVRREK